MGKRPHPLHLPLGLLVAVACVGGWVLQRTHPKASAPTSTPFPNPKRVISLAPSLTEMAFAMGAEGNLVGVTDMCDTPPEARRLAQVGSFTKPNLERILSLHPDLVMTVNPMPPLVTESLTGAGVAIAELRQSSLWDLFPTLEEMGRLLGHSDEASGLVRSLRSRLETVSSTFQSIPWAERPRVFIEIWHDPLTAPGQSSFITEVIAAAGGVSVTGESKGDYVQISHDAIVTLNPSVIVLTEMGESKPSLESIRQRIGWEGMDAVRAGRIVDDIDPSLLLRPGPRLVDGVESLHERLYPGGAK